MDNNPEIQEFAALLSPKLIEKYMPHNPTPPQEVFLLYNGREAFYGGAAGGGKSDALLMAALQYVDVPGYHALLLRRTFPDLNQPDAIMDRARQWLAGSDAKWNELKKTWIFPSGATLTFGFLEHEIDKYRYQGAALQFVGFDELTQFTATQYEYLFTRLRRGSSPESRLIPVRMRAASNPPDTEDGEWVKRRFIDEKKGVFIPAKYTDNPHIDREDYDESFAQISDPVLRKQLQDGDWNLKRAGKIFTRASFPITRIKPVGISARGWDLAATPRSVNPLADYTCGAKVVRSAVPLANGAKRYIIVDMRRGQWGPGDVERLVKMTAEADGRSNRNFMEQEPGAAGKTVIHHYKTNVFGDGYGFEGIRSTGEKIVANQIISILADNGQLELLEGPWNEKFIDEAVLFPEGPHDDQLDAVRIALNGLLGSKEVKWDLL